jgi:hypothetical protein
VSLYHQDAALRVIAKLKNEIKEKKTTVLQQIEKTRLKNSVK